MDENLLNRISSFGVLGYPIDKIIFLLDPPDPDTLRAELDTPGSEAYNAYQKGKATGEYSLDKALFDEATKNKDIDANDRMRARLHLDKIDNKIKTKFDL
ncbi:MAG: hypothetical protein LBP56_00285 [Odoribacteraceae bacterium]|jgi:hypothetical protein|nr:hypothetical protein [Odoribacteraceae bacterium]